MEDTIHILKERAEAALKQLGEGVQGASQLAESVVNDLQAKLSEHPTTGGQLGPLLGRLKAAMRAQSEFPSCGWVGVCGGRLAVGHRPKIKGMHALRQQGATHILTLLCESEGAAEIGAATKRAGLDWLWLPLESATPPGKERLTEVRGLYQSLREVLAAGDSVYVHCSAGIHRTGMITYGLLRSMGMSGAAARATLRAMREETGEGVGEARLAWGEQFSPPVSD